MEFQTCVFLTVVTASLFMLVDANYQLEIDLRSYSNPSRRVMDQSTGGNGACCDTAATDGSCIPQDTCDVIFDIEARNFRRQNSELAPEVQLGTFENSDSITFINCSLIMGGRNPLLITFPASSYSPSAREQIRLNIEISDEDIDLNTRDRSLIRIQNFIYEIPRSQPTSSAFSSLQTLESSHTPPLRLTFRFRLACTPGSCGSDCTQTSNCTPFPNACELECNNAMQCQNGGRCMEGFCACPPGFIGVRCSIRVTTSPPTPPITPPPTMTVRSPSSMTPSITLSSMNPSMITSTVPSNMNTNTTMTLMTTSKMTATSRGCSISDSLMMSLVLLLYSSSVVFI